MEREPRSGCPINQAVEAFGDRWSLLVLRDIVFGGRRHFRELLAGNQEGIASNILADRLQRLVASGLLTRDDPGRGRRATYSLTEHAIALVPVFAALGLVGSAAPGDRRAAAGARRAARVRRARTLWAAFMAELRAVHLGAPAPAGPSATERLAAAYADALGQTAAS